MKKINLITIFLIITTAFITSACEVIGGIFNAGMSVGIFIVIAIIVVIVVIFTSMTKTKS